MEVDRSGSEGFVDDQSRGGVDVQGIERDRPAPICPPKLAVLELIVRPSAATLPSTLEPKVMGRASHRKHALKTLS